MHITRDKLWKSIIEDFWLDFLRYFFPDIEHLIDFERDAIFLNKDLDQLFPDRQEGDRRVDVLMQVWLKDGTNHWFLVHTEIQGYDDDSFARRMYLYHTRILDKHKRHLTSMVVFLNENADFQPAEYRHAFAGTELVLRYRTFVVNDQTYESLYKPGNPFGLVLQTAWVAIKGEHVPKHESDAWLYQQKAILHRRMLADGYSSTRSRRFLSFLAVYISFTNTAIEEQFQTEVSPTDSTRKPMGIIELVTEEATRTARLEGERRKMLLFIRQLVADTDFDNARIARLTDGTPELVQIIRERVLAGNNDTEDLIKI